MNGPVADLIVAFDWFVLGYFLALNTSYLVLVSAAATVTTRSRRRPDQSSHDDIFANPQTPPISVLISAYDEQEGIVQAVRATLLLRYPKFEVVVVDDGSTDATFERLREEYDLVPTVLDLEQDVPTIGEVLSMHVPRGGEPVVVVRKRNTGRRADALNVGLNAVRYPLVCCVDADSILEPDALLRVAKPYVDDPQRVVASGGVVRAVNGSTVHHGQITRTRQPRSWLARIQIVEYLRSFLLGRTGWARFGTLLIISGAFGLYRRDLLVEVGGFDPEAMGEDADMLFSIHRHQRDLGRDYRVVCVPEPVSWTEVPTTIAALGRQRRRWSRGLAQALWKQRSMIGRPRYGRIGMVGLPYFVVFELLGPVIELAGVTTVVLGLALGIVSIEFLLLLTLVAVVLGIGISFVALLIEEVSYHRYPRWRDLLVGVVAAILENLGYRQLHAWWRLRGVVSAVKGGNTGWGEMKRTGFDREGCLSGHAEESKVVPPTLRDDKSMSVLRSGCDGASTEHSDFSRRFPTMAPAPAPALGDAIDARSILDVLTRLQDGDLTARMPADLTGVAGKAADGLNAVIRSDERLVAELARVSQVVGKQGNLSQRVASSWSNQRWSTSVTAVNDLIDDLVRPTIEMQRVIGAVADGDLSKKVSSEGSGEILQLNTTINAMVDQLNGFASELTRVAREVGTEGKLGQAAAVTIEVGGVWKDLTDNVNLMAGNLTGQVRNIAEVTTAVANGDLSKKISIDVKGEFLELKNTVNAMVDQLNAFAGEVTRVAREVGVEGKLGGQAQSNEIGGVWKDLTDNVNQLAANLTNQVRAIADVATAVTEGDLTRQVHVEANGEVAVLKDTLNEMIRNLRETTRQNVEQDWLKTNRERFTRMLQGQRDLDQVAAMILTELASLVSAQHGVFYTMTTGAADREDRLEFQAGYGFEERKHLATSFRLGQGLVGQCAREKKRILLTDVPGDYVKISSGLGEATPLNIVVLPVLFEGSVHAVVELASFSAFSVTHLAFLDQITESIGLVLNTVEGDTLTDNLLKQAQTQGVELQAQQEALRETNEDLGRQAELLAEQNIATEEKKQELEVSKHLVEEKAEQLAISSKYKSEFIANMSHELRTPLNSLLILAEQLADNPDRNMTDTQVEYAEVICSSGKDLLALLNSILDLAKVGSGTVVPDRAALDVPTFCADLRREFDHVARAKGLGFSVSCAPDGPHEIVTDPRRLHQVFTNLLSNAFKFTAAGEVSVGIGYPDDDWRTDRPTLTDAAAVVAITVSDTGIGIDDDQQGRIFEEFAQGDGTTARVYGGTGLGLSISREIVTLLGGEVTVQSTLGEGSTFTVCLPADPPPATDQSPRPARQVGVGAGRPGSTPEGDRNGPLAPVVQPARPREPAVVGDGGRDDGFYEQVAWATERARPVEATLDSTKVLIVDDDFRNVFALTALLERSHAVVMNAESGDTAIATLQATPDIDIVLMDIMMPIMDGYETIRSIRTMERFAGLPIIAVTGKVIPGERQRCLDAGATDYVPKPVDTAELRSALAPWLPLAAGTT